MLVRGFWRVHDRINQSRGSARKQRAAGDTRHLEEIGKPAFPHTEHRASFSVEEVEAAACLTQWRLDRGVDADPIVELKWQ